MEEPPREEMTAAGTTTERHNQKRKTARCLYFNFQRQPTAPQQTSRAAATLFITWRETKYPTPPAHSWHSHFSLQISQDGPITIQAEPG